MQELLLFISRIRSLFLLLFLEIVAFTLIVRYNHSQRSIFVNTSQYFSGVLLNQSNKVTHFFTLPKINESLAAENANLKTQLAASENSSTKQLQSNDSTFIFYPVKVINNRVSSNRNFITLNKGSKEGLSPKMGLIDHKGIVGIIKNVSENYATAYSLLHEDVRISVKLKKDNTIGTIVWRPTDTRYAELINIPKYDNVGRGDTILTSGFSTIFPEGIHVGAIEGIDVSRGIKRIRVKLFNDISKISHVYAIKHQYQKEILEIEATLDD